MIAPLVTPAARAEGAVEFAARVAPGADVCLFDSGTHRAWLVEASASAGSSVMVKHKADVHTLRREAGELLRGMNVRTVDLLRVVPAAVLSALSASARVGHELIGADGALLRVPPA